MIGAAAALVSSPLASAASRTAGRAQYENALIAELAQGYVGQWGGYACADAHRSGETGSTTVYPTYPAGSSATSPPQRGRRIDPAVGGDGQCRSFVNCVVWIASGHTQWLGLYPSDYFKAFTHPSGGGPPGTEITSVSDLARGDIVQQGKTASAPHLHTYVIVKRLGGHDFEVVDSNHALDEYVQEHQISVDLSTNVRAFRMGAIGKPTAVPTLGRQWALYQKGYGEVKPATIFNGGDPTGLVQHVRWTHWGSRRAIASGTGDWVWPGLSVARGSTQARAVVVAYDLGLCQGALAYRKIQWFFPRYGESFDPRRYINICSGRYSHYPQLSDFAKCRGVALRSPKGRASQIQALGITCRAARRVIATSPSVRYLHGGGRFRHEGLYCGSEGYGPVSPPTLFECARGSIDIIYEVAA